MQSAQLSLGLSNPDFTSKEVEAAIDLLALNAEVESRGAIFMRGEVVDFILDLAGYTEDLPLHEKQLLEPEMTPAVA